MAPTLRSTARPSSRLSISTSSSSSTSSSRNPSPISKLSNPIPSPSECLKRKRSSSSDASDSPYSLSTHMPWPSQLCASGPKDQHKEKKVKERAEQVIVTGVQGWSLKAYMVMLREERESLGSRSCSPSEGVGSPR